ncbi:MAG: ribonuclease III [Solirubrobacterales bacterium]
MKPIEKAKSFLAANQLKVNDIGLIVKALTHPSYAQEHEGTQNYQRLEFLGDSVLNLIVAVYLYQELTDRPEGVLTKIRSRVVCEKHLVKTAKTLMINEYLILGRGEENSGGRNRDSILADAVEAIIGALYLDQGLEYAAEFILPFVRDDIDRLSQGDFYDFKSRLQELAQSTGKDNVFYEILKESGPAHNRTFEAAVYFQNRLLAKGAGKSKKEAEQKAAEIALQEHFS